MPYERQTRSTGFRGSTGVLKNSTKLRQQAKQAEKDRIESVSQAGKQASSVGDELSRIFQIANANDEFNLNQLAKFSETLNEGLKAAAENVAKPYIAEKREEGILKGRRDANGDSSAFDLDEDQNAQIAEAVAKQREAVLKRMDKFDEEAYKATLEEKARALNLRKMGANVSWGYRIGYLQEKAKGWNAYLTTEIGTSKDIIGKTTDDRDIVVGEFWNYDPEIQQDIIKYVEDKFIAEVSDKSGINQSLINTNLIKAVTEQTSKFQEEVLNVRIREQGKEEFDRITLEVSNAISKLDGKKQHKELRIQMDSALSQLKSVTRRMSYGRNLEGTLQETANSLLKNIIVEAISSDEASFENIDELEKFLTTEKFEIPGLTKKAKYDEDKKLIEGTGGKLLSEIWPSEFNTEALIGDALKKYNDKVKQEDDSKLSLVKKTKASILSEFYNGNITLAEAQLKSQALRDKYEGVPGVHTQLFNLDEELKEPKYYTPEISRKGIENLLADSIEGTITSDKLITKEGRIFNQEVVQEYRDKGLIVDDDFLQTNREKELAKTFDTNFEELINQKVLNSLSKQDRDLIGVDKVVTYARHWVLSEAKDLIKNNSNLTVPQAMRQAINTVEQALIFDHDDDDKTTSTRTVNGVTQEGIFQFDIGTGRWLKEELNSIPLDKTEQAIERRQKTRILEQTFEAELNGSSGEVDLLATKSYLPKEYFKLTNGKPLPIFQKLANLDNAARTEKRSRFEIYNLQAALHDDIDPIDIPEDAAKAIDLVENLTTTNKEIITNNASTRATSRVLNEVGIVDTGTILNSLAFDGATLITADELPALLELAGLNEMSYDEVLKNPAILKKLTKAKLSEITELANKETDNKNIAIRMIATGMVHGKDAMNEWDGKHDVYSRQALKNYVSGDYTPLSNIGSSSVLIADGRVNRENDPNPITRTLPTTLAELESLQLEFNALEAPKRILEQGLQTAEQRSKKPPGVRQVTDFFGLNKQYVCNPEYPIYMERQQRLKDLITIHQELGTLGVWDAKDRRPFAKAMIRVIGQDRWDQLINEALDNPAWGSRKAGVQIISALVQGLPEFSDTDFTYDDIDDSIFTLDSPYSGNIPESALTNLDNNASLKRQLVFGRDFKIRRDVAPDLIRMVNDARKAGHTNIQFTSGYRNYDEQAKEHKNDPKLALPAGKSQHGLGTAIDINLPHVDGVATEETIALHKWLLENKHKYNFHTIEGFDVNIGEDGKIPDEAWHFEWKKPN